MTSAEFFLQSFGPVLLWVSIGLCGTVGLVALVSPRFLSSLNIMSKRWVDTDKYVAWTETQVDVDRFFVRHSRLFGLVAVLTAGALTYVFLWR